ncbi:MAG: bifunctional hydroxymethylpyrimidine kinase/phosphomethylpyrimidine kinase [Acidobacteriota bacterium]|nr:bifunctional hydroxymethylpyrimidine kinase/phosphomethylpyrimidine kinase [Acidobacteriota bacterium]
MFLDLVFAALEQPPALGTEVRAAAFEGAPGGLANVAVALARLGVDVSLSAILGDDLFGRHLWETLERERVDLTYSQRVEGWGTPVTAAIAYGGDRELVTHELPLPTDPAALLPADCEVDALLVPLAGAELDWLRALRRHAPLIVADTASEPWGVDRELFARKLAHVDVVLPNAPEALAATGAATLDDALPLLAQTGVLPVVTCGAEGAVTIDSADGTILQVPAPRVAVRDTTGAGDVFAAGIVLATLEGLPLRERLRFANLCASESVKRLGGSLAAPTLAEVAELWTIGAPEAVQSS